MTTINITEAGWVSMASALLGASLLFVALMRMSRHQRAGSLSMVSGALTVVGVLMAMFASLASTPGWDLVAALAASFILGQGVFYSLQVRIGRRVASCIGWDSLTELARSSPDQLKEANERLQVQIEKAQDYSYYRYAFYAGAVPLGLVVLITFLGVQ